VARIAFVHVPFYSHVQAGMRLTSVVARQGHEVLVVGPDRAREHAESLGATFELMDAQMPKLGGMDYYADLTATTEELSEELIDLLYARGIDLILHDSQAPWARVSGDYLGIPRIVAHPMFPIVTDYTKPSLTDPRWIPSASPEQAQARYNENWLSIARRWGVEIESPHRLIHSPARAWFTFTTERIIGDHQIDPEWHCVGPLMPAPAPPAPDERPLVYVCFGTAYNRRPELFQAVITALADQPVDLLLSAGKRPGFGGPGLLSTEHLDDLPPNVTVEDFVSAPDVLRRASVHITHAGCNSVHETLLAGVPMVCIPQALDQFPLSHRVELLGAGVVSQEGPRDIREAVEVVIEGSKARARALELRDHLIDYDGEPQIAAVIEQVLNEHTLLSA
jgi:MGT family glycosyltransferase